MIKYDCHTHTSFSSDSEASCESQIEAAIAAGLEGICITDHMDLDFPCIEQSGCTFLFDTDAYFEELGRLKLKYADRINILSGIELGLRNEDGIVPDMSRRYERLLGSYPFDMVIGSTHCLEYTDPYYPDYWQGKSCRQGLELYFKAIYDNIRNYDCYDTCGHLDYLVRYVPKRDDPADCWQGSASYIPSDYSDIIDLILRELIHRGKALEVNSAGLKYGLGFAHPKEEILTRYRELGGELITIGSDAHQNIHIAHQFKAVNDMLMKLGFKYYTVYEARVPVGFVLF